MNSNIKLIGLDLDGTSLNPEGTAFTDKTKEIFRRAKNKGVDIVIATGRSYYSLPEDVLNSDVIEYVVTSNGAITYDLKNKKQIHKNCIQADKVEELIEIFKNNKCIIDVFTEGKAYQDQKDYDDVMNDITSFRPKEYIKATRTPVKDIYAFLYEHKNNIENISINYMNPEDKITMEKILSSVDEITLTSSVPTNNEVGAKDSHKANGLKAILDIKGLTYENLMAAGDNPNDLTMIKAAKIGVAMGNASVILKESADYVTLTNHEDGVALAIEKLILEK